MDITFKEASGYNDDGSEKSINELKFPNERLLIEQLGNIQELVIGGYHALDCVKRVAEVALSNRINTLVDLDVTDLFFNLYKEEKYFRIDSYEPNRFKNYMIEEYGEELAEYLINKNYQSQVYGFTNSISNKKK